MFVWCSSLALFSDYLIKVNAVSGHAYCNTTVISLHTGCKFINTSVLLPLDAVARRCLKDADWLSDFWQLVWRCLIVCWIRSLILFNYCWPWKENEQKNKIKNSCGKKILERWISADWLSDFWLLVFSLKHRRLIVCWISSLILFIYCLPCKENQQKKKKKKKKIGTITYVLFILCPVILFYICGSLAFSRAWSFEGMTQQ